MALQKMLLVCKVNSLTRFQNKICNRLQTMSPYFEMNENGLVASRFRHPDILLTRLLQCKRINEITKRFLKFYQKK